jgi:tRNA A37 threonylcarbamoyladenosine biosynthesis protein TsaE
MRCAFRLAAASAGKSILARMAMMAMTTNNSMRVKAPTFLFRDSFMFS